MVAILTDYVIGLRRLLGDRFLCHERNFSCPGSGRWEGYCASAPSLSIKSFEGVRPLGRFTSNG
jgi:hypothetical protein